MPCKHLCTLGGRRRSLARNAVTARKCATVGPHAAGLGNMHMAPVCRVAWYAAEGHSHARTVHSSATQCCRARGACSRKLHHHRNQQRSHRQTVSASMGVLAMPHLTHLLPFCSITEVRVHKRTSHLRHLPRPVRQYPVQCTKRQFLASQLARQQQPHRRACSKSGRFSAAAALETDNRSHSADTNIPKAPSAHSVLPWCSCMLQLDVTSLTLAPRAIAELCSDHPPPGKYGCDEQRDFDKCWADFMVAGDFCKRTCGRCQGAEHRVDRHQQTSPPPPASSMRMHPAPLQKAVLCAMPCVRRRCSSSFRPLNCMQAIAMTSSHRASTPARSKGSSGSARSTTSGTGATAPPPASAVIVRPDAHADTRHHNAIPHCTV